MELIKENTTRKIDSMGRVSIPKSIRDRLGLREGEEIEVYTIKDGTNTYVAFAKPTPQKPNITKEDIMRLLNEDTDYGESLMRMFADQL
jgi:AbrB family looped-hinge helix DNA binding protein